MSQNSLHPFFYFFVYRQGVCLQDAFRNFRFVRFHVRLLLSLFSLAFLLYHTSSNNAIGEKQAAFRLKNAEMLQQNFQTDQHQNDTTRQHGSLLIFFPKGVTNVDSGNR